MSNNTRVVEVYTNDGQTLQFRHYNGGSNPNNAYTDIGKKDTEHFSEPVDLLYVAVGNNLQFDYDNPVTWTQGMLDISRLNHGCLKFLNWSMNQQQEFKFKLNMLWNTDPSGNGTWYPIQSEDPIIINKPNTGE